MRSTEIVTAFWDEVWNAHEPDAVDRFVADDVVIEAGGQEISGKDNVKNWVKGFLDHVNGKPVWMTGTAVWTVGDGRLQRGWVKQASFELYHSLLAD
jgi:ketosteroid isomerase-like protein